MAFTPSSLSAFGIGRETAPGTAVAPTYFPPFASVSPVDVREQLIDEGFRGSMGSQYGAVQGPASSTLEMSGPGFMDSMGALLHNILGDYAAGVAADGVVPHTFALLNSDAGKAQPPTHTFVDSQQLTATTGAREYPHMCLSELTFTGNVEGLFEVSANGQAFSSKAAASPMVNTPTSETVIPSWRSTVSMDAAGLDVASEWSLTLTRALTPIWVANGAQDPISITRGRLTVSGSLTLWAEDETPLLDYIANDQPPLVLTINNGGVGSAERELAITCSKIARSETPQTREGGSPLGYQVSFIGLMNTTDAGTSGKQSPCKAVLKNAVTDYAA